VTAAEIAGLRFDRSVDVSGGHCGISEVVRGERKVEVVRSR
jgi:hypothetical protein